MPGINQARRAAGVDGSVGESVGGGGEYGVNLRARMEKRRIKTLIYIGRRRWGCDEGPAEGEVRGDDGLYCASNVIGSLLGTWRSDVGREGKRRKTRCLTLLR
jgi:hypothetical protein